MKRWLSNLAAGSILSWLVRACAILSVLAGMIYFGGPMPSQVHADLSTVNMNCNSGKAYDTNTNGSTVLVSATTTGGIYVCGYSISAQASPTAVNVKLVFGPLGVTCATTPTSLTPAYQFTPSNAAPIMDTSPFYRGLFVPPGNDLCINTSSGQSVQALVYYYQQRP
jgi:hypothetical protein